MKKGPLFRTAATMRSDLRRAPRWPIIFCCCCLFFFFFEKSNRAALRRGVIVTRQRNRKRNETTECREGSQRAPGFFLFLFLIFPPPSKLHLSLFSFVLSFLSFSLPLSLLHAKKTYPIRKPLLPPLHPRKRRRKKKENERKKEKTEKDKKNSRVT